MLVNEYNNLIKNYRVKRKRYNSLGNFLDSYYLSKNEDKAKIFKKEPEFGKMRKCDRTYLVCSFIYLCEKDKIEIPSWMNNRKFALKEPYFTDEGCGEKMKGYLVANSPSCYRIYNVFTEEKPLRRC